MGPFYLRIVQCQGVSSNNDCCPVEVWLRPTKLYRTAMNFKRHIPDSNELQKTHIPDCDEIQKKPLVPKRHERVFMKGGEGKKSQGVDFRSLSQKSCGRCVIIANLLRCYRIRVWSCTSSTLPAPSSSAPCILAILTYLQGGVS